MAEKQTKLSIVIRTVDNATAKIKAISDRLDAATKPLNDFKQSLGDLRSKSGLDDVIGGFQGVAGAVKDLFGRLLVVGGVIATATAGMLKLVDGFDELGDKAESAGVAVDFLASLRYAAERSGTAAAKLDNGLVNLSKNMGEMRAGGGPLLSFLGKVSPALLRQIKATEGNEEAFALLANAMAKIHDPAKRAAFAQKAFGDASLAPLLARGAAGIKELQARYLELAGSQEGAVGEAGKVDDAMKDLKAATDGVKAALVEGLAPALKIIVERLRAFFTENRARIAEWAKDLGTKLPGAVAKLVDIFHGIVDAVRPFVDSSTKLKLIAVALAGVIVGPLISSIYALGVALLTTPVGWIVGGIAAIAAGAYVLIDNWDTVAAFFAWLWDGVKGAFGAAWDFIAGGVSTVLGGAADLVMAAWEPISSFFAGLWGGITSVFEQAWKVIDRIVGKITGAVDKVIGAARAVGDFLFGGDDLGDITGKMWARARGDVSGQARAAVAGARGGSSEARVTVDFANAPRGTRVQADPQSTADVDLSVGYQHAPGAA